MINFFRPEYNPNPCTHKTKVVKEQDYSCYKFFIDPSSYNKSEIVQYIRNLYTSEPTHSTKFLSCWQTNYFLHKTTNFLDQLIQIINLKSSAIIDLNNGYKLQVAETWAAVYQKGDYTDLHGHGRHCHYSGVLYLETDIDHPPLIFEDGYTANCSENYLYIFSSEYKHMVPVNQIDKLRIILGINLYIIPSICHESN